jgi:hypothetical protein
MSPLFISKLGVEQEGSNSLNLLDKVELVLAVALLEELLAEIVAVRGQAQ